MIHGSVAAAAKAQSPQWCEISVPPGNDLKQTMKTATTNTSVSEYFVRFDVRASHGVIGAERHASMRARFTTMSFARGITIEAIVSTTAMKISRASKRRRVDVKIESVSGPSRMPRARPTGVSSPMRGVIVTAGPKSPAARRTCPRMQRGISSPSGAREGDRIALARTLPVATLQPPPGQWH